MDSDLFRAWIDALRRNDFERAWEISDRSLRAYRDCVAVPRIEVLAARIMALDLVITVDTMVAHLAGALGAPVWTMLHRNCDRRWPLIGPETIWYPTMRLFHQKRAGDWTDVIEEMIGELKAFGRRSGPSAASGAQATSNQD